MFGAISSSKSLPRGFGAGTFLGGLLFIVKFYGACLRPPIPRPLTNNKGMQVKFVYDACQIASINLKKSHWFKTLFQGQDHGIMMKELEWF